MFKYLSLFLSVCVCVCVCCGRFDAPMQEATVTPSPPPSTTCTPASSVSTAATSEAESGMSGLRRKLETEFESSPEPPSKLARYDTMPSFSFNADSSPESTTGSKNQLFEPPKADPLEYFRLDKFGPM